MRKVRPLSCPPQIETVRALPIYFACFLFGFAAKPRYLGQILIPGKHVTKIEVYNDPNEKAEKEEGKAGGEAEVAGGEGGELDLSIEGTKVK
jgi:hypothetical protein